MPEEALQIQIMDWIQLQYPEIYDDVYHIANERKCNPYRGYILKRMGVKPGIADIFVDVSRGTSPAYKGMWIELKSAKGKLTRAQTAFLERERAKGYHCECVNSFEAAVLLITVYLSL